MVSFNSDFQMSFCPSSDRKVTDEFSHAHDLVRRFSPVEETVDQCFASIQQSFSQETRSNYGRAVRAFVRAAKKELEERASAVGVASIMAEAQKRSSDGLEEPMPLKNRCFSPEKDGSLATISRLFDWKLPTKENITFYTSLLPVEIDDLIFLGENHFVTTIDSKAEELLKERSFLGLLRRICRKKPRDADEAARFLAIAESCHSLFLFPQVVDLDEDNSGYVRHIPQFFPYLTKDERWVCLFNLPANVRVYLFYLSESQGFLEEDLQELPLSVVPTEILVRFLGSKPFPEIQAWLKGMVLAGEGEFSRCDTLLPEQKKAILSRFTRYESSLPLTCWMDLFQVKDADLERLMQPAFLTEPRYHFHRWLSRELQSESKERMMKVLDPYDPLSLFLLSEPYIKPSKPTWAVDLVLYLLKCCSCEMQICGGRTFVTWGNAQPESSHCATQNDPPLHGRYQGKPITLYPRGLWNDVTFGVPAISLRRLILEASERGPICERNRIKDPILRGEIHRIATKLGERYPQLETLLRGGRMPSLKNDVMDSLQQEKTFASLFKEAYGMSVRGSRLKSYDYNNPVHRHAFMYLTLFLLGRKVIVLDEADDTTYIAFTGNVFFRLKSLNREEFTVSPEDNPGIRNLASYASDYPLHTLSPITPPEITPLDFIKFIASIQSLNEKDFNDCCLACIKMLSEEISDETPYEEYFAVWKRLCPQNIFFDEMAPVMIRLAKNYYGHVDALTETLLPNKMYLLDRNGLDRFSKVEEIPEFVQDLGSFASALCKFYIPHKPERHDGDCAVNSFLLGLHGKDAYASQGRNLGEDIQQFREDIVKYACGHTDTLKGEFGEAALHELLFNYSRNQGFDSWTTREVWTIAARLYGCKINIFSINHDGYFRTNEHGVVVPFDEETEVFKPQGDDAGIPINLLMWGPHYCFLERK